MTAASFWSLLLPALEIGEQMHSENKIYTLFPVVFGFLLGASFVYVTDILIPDNVGIISFNKTFLLDLF